MTLAMPFRASQYLAKNKAEQFASVFYKVLRLSILHGANKVL